jgi:DnaJ-domain-containing protein 1
MVGTPISRARAFRFDDDRRHDHSGFPGALKMWRARIRRPSNNQLIIVFVLAAFIVMLGVITLIFIPI